MVVVVKYRHRAIVLLFKDKCLKFSPAESEDVVQYLKKIYGDQFKPLVNRDLLSGIEFQRVHRMGKPRSGSGNGSRTISPHF